MQCGFDYCIYNKNLKCMLDEIEINSAGYCESCIRVSFADSALEGAKASQRKRLACDIQNIREK